MSEFEKTKCNINLINDIKCSHYLEMIFSFLNQKEKLNMIIYNNQLKNLLGVKFQDYKTISGRYKIDGKNGMGREYTLKTNKLIFEGEYINKKRHGKGKEYYDDGKLKYEGEYLNGTRNGKGKEFYNDEKLKSEGEYINGKKNGNWKEYYDDGKIKFEGEYLNDEILNGKVYNKNGIVDLQIINGNGKGKEYHDNGDLKFEGEYKNGKRNDKGKEYNYCGQLKFEGEYLNGKKNGKGKDYNLIGLLEFEGEYKDGEKWNGKVKEYKTILIF